MVISERWFWEHSHIVIVMLRRKSKAAKELAKKVGEQHWQVRIEGGFWRAVIRRQSLEGQIQPIEILFA